ALAANLDPGSSRVHRAFQFLKSDIPSVNVSVLGAQAVMLAMIAKLEFEVWPRHRSTGASMKIKCIAGFAVITKQPDASASLYQDALGLPFERQDSYLYMDKFAGSNHFGIWPLKMAAQSCFGQNEWPAHIPVPTATIEFELEDVAAVESAVQEMKSKGQVFIHEVRTEPWGQTSARFMSPEGVLVGLSYAPWLHEKEAR
ncbi:VOC family protein, partial [Paraburkholderia sp.]|uniref:VOC family protein n=1 Tax=Paraburkholderia sp. TaxID=1926495 RepID=UPI0025F3D825